MDPIDNVRRSLELLRQQLAQKTAQPGDANASAAVTAATHAPPGRSARQTATRKIRALQRQDAAYTEKAINAFIESVLAHEFGEGIVNDPEFQDMVKQVQEIMTSDASLSSQLHALIQDLAATP